jgi:hypothetical protein
MDLIIQHTVKSRSVIEWPVHVPDSQYDSSRKSLKRLSSARKKRPGIADSSGRSGQPRERHAEKFGVAAPVRKKENTTGDESREAALRRAGGAPCSRSPDADNRPCRCPHDADAGNVSRTNADTPVPRNDDGTGPVRGSWRPVDAGGMPAGPWMQPQQPMPYQPIPNPPLTPIRREPVRRPPLRRPPLGLRSATDHHGRPGGDSPAASRSRRLPSRPSTVPSAAGCRLPPHRLSSVHPPPPKPAAAAPSRNRVRLRETRRGFHIGDLAGCDDLPPES